MFDVESSDLFKAPLTYRFVNGTDVFASKVKLSLPVPWLEVVCGRKSEEVIYLLSSLCKYEVFAETPAAQKIRSITGRVLDRRTGKLKSVALSAVVTFGGVAIGFRSEDGALFDPLTLKPDLKKGKRQPEKILFQAHKTRARKPRDRQQQDSVK